MGETSLVMLESVVGNDGAVVPNDASS